MRLDIAQSIQKLGDDFAQLNWNFQEKTFDGRKELVSQWLGEPNEDIMVCVFKGREIHERFHRQDFFFINYAYTGDYGAQSYRFDNHVTICKDDCYIGQPFSGYALYGASDEDIVIVGVLIRKEVFYRNFLQIVSADKSLLRFFLDPQVNSFSDEFIHLKDLKDSLVRPQIELLVTEYANRDEMTQDVLKPMTLTLLTMLARQFRKTCAEEEGDDLTAKMIRYIEEHLDHVTLAMLSVEFGYHPAYISSRFSEKVGQTFSQLLLSKRMERAVFLMQNTDLSIEEIAPMVGYADKSNFHKAFRTAFGKAPRQLMLERRQARS